MPQRKADEGWETVNIPLLELTALEYLSRVDRLYPVGREMVGTDDLADGPYFTGRSRLKKASLLARYGDNPNGFVTAGRFWGEAGADGRCRVPAQSLSADTPILPALAGERGVSPPNFHSLSIAP
jgi:hypothetical protein